MTRAAGLIVGALLRAEAAMGGDGLLFEASIGLFTTGPALSPNMVLGQFTAADFTGYAALTAQTWGTAYLDQSNQLQLTSPTLQWTCSADGDPNTIRGYYAWREDTPDVLLFADTFSVPIVIEFDGDGVAFVINFEMSLLNHGTYLFVP